MHSGVLHGVGGARVNPLLIFDHLSEPFVIGIENTVINLTHQYFELV
jgi:hypothetical protein